MTNITIPESHAQSNPPLNPSPLEKRFTFHLYNIGSTSPFQLQSRKSTDILEISAKDYLKTSNPLFNSNVIYLSPSDRVALATALQNEAWKDFFDALSYFLSAEDLVNPSEEERLSQTRDISKPFILLSALKLRADLTTELESCILCSLSTLYICGIGTEVNSIEGLKCLKLSADAGLLSAQLRLSRLYDIEANRDNKAELAFKYFKMAADQGDASAQNRTADCYQKGIGTPKNEEMSFKYNKLAAKQGHAIDQYNLAFCYKKGLGTPVNHKKALYYCELSAQQGLVRAQYSMGNSYQVGMGTKINLKKAFQYYMLAANQNNAQAQYDVGNAYEGGLGVKMNPKEAFRYYKMAADAGLSQAQCALGLLYENGFGTEINLQEAYKYYQLSAGQGFAAAQKCLGIFHLLGKISPPDHKKAFVYFKLAADQGDSIATYDLGILYYKGIGTEKDIQKAFECLEKYTPHFPTDQSALNFVKENILEFDNSFNRTKFMKQLKALPPHELLITLKYEILQIKIYKCPLENKIFDHVPNIKRIRDLLTEVSKLLDRQLELLTYEELSSLIYNLSSLRSKVLGLNFTEEASTSTADQESFIDDLMPKKPAKKQPVKKAKQTEALIKIPETPSPHPHPKIEPTPKQKSHVAQSPKAPPAPKKAASKAATVEAENLKAIDSIMQETRKRLADLVQRENEMKLFYLKRCEGQIYKLMQALFDKDDMTVPEVNKLIEHLAATYEGETRQGTRTGGMLILKIGDLTTGGHAPHGGKTTVDRGALADLRQLLASHYMTHLCSETQ